MKEVKERQQEGGRSVGLMCVVSCSVRSVWMRRGGRWRVDLRGCGLDVG